MAEAGKKKKKGKNFILARRTFAVLKKIKIKINKKSNSQLSLNKKIHPEEKKIKANITIT